MCNICKQIDPALSNRENARRIGVNESTIRRHKREHDPFLQEHDIPLELVSSRGKSVRDPETGSWEKVTWYPNKKAIHESLQYDDLSRILDNWAVSEYTDKGNNFTDTLHAADLQIGKANQAGGGTPETLASVRRSFERFAHSLRQDNPEAAVLADGGDIIENIFNVASQAATNDLPVTEQIRVARRVMLEGIKLLAPLVPVLTYVTVPSNHGSVRSSIGKDAHTVDDDFGLEISYQLEDVISNNSFLKDRVQFLRPEKLQETAVGDFSGTRLAFNHGHNAAPGKAALWWSKQDHGRLPGWDADILSINHYHNMYVMQSGNGRWIIQNASSDPGSDWYTYKSGESSLRGMTAYKVRDGQWLDLRLL